MDRLNRTDFNNLAQTEELPAVSIYLATEQSGAATRQNPIRYKTLLKNAQEQLLARGLRDDDVDAVLEPARRLVNDQDLWQHADTGLAVFISPTTLATYRLPVDFREFAFAGERFYLTPLFPLFTYDGTFYVLAVSRDSARVIKCSRQSAEEVKPEHMPRSLADVLQRYEREKQLSFHTRTNQRLRSSGGERQAMFFGQGAGAEEVKEKVTEYLQQVSKGMRDYLAGNQAPVVLAAGASTQGAYREVDRSPNLLDQGIETDVDDVSPEDLQQQAWPLVQPIMERPLQRALSIYGNARSTGLVVSDPQQVIPAAVAGRVGEVFVDIRAEKWGEYDPVNHTATIHESRLPADDELLNFAATHVHLTGGLVHAVPTDIMPDRSPIAAIFRY